MNPNPIGVFDSGVGGLAVVREIRRALPHEDILYYADTAYFPYGPRPAAEIQRRAKEITQFLLDMGAKVMVVACNTASSAALAELRASFPVPFVGMVPAVKPASAQTQSGKVGVIATEATVQGQVFADLMAQFAQGITVLTRACPHLAEMVERGEVDSPHLHSLLHSYLDPLMAEGIDVLVLGCTHYPFLRPAIEQVLGDGVVVIDTSAPVARQVERVLLGADFLTPNPSLGKVTCFASGDTEQFLAVARRLLPELLTA